ncbi:CARDB domain-containing protein [Corallococcus terminator]
MKARSSVWGVTGLATMLVVSACDESVGPVAVEEVTEGASVETERSALSAAPAPDFVVTSVTGPASIQDGGMFDARVTVCNQGPLPSSGTEVELYLSADAVITADLPLTPASDARVGQFMVEPLQPGGCQTRTTRVQANAPIPGAYFLGAIVNARRGGLETDWSNNTQASASFGVGSRPDFVVTSVTGPASVAPGQSFAALVTACNVGTVPAMSIVRLYLSADAVITSEVPLVPTSDVLLGEVILGMLSPGQCQTESKTVTASVPREGAYTLGAIVDPALTMAELIEDNNTKAGSRMGVGLRPDFVVASVTAPASVAPGQSLTASAEVCNQGTVRGATTVELYLTADEVITPHVPPNPLTDTRLGTQDTGPLEPGACRTVSFTSTPPGLVPGAYHVGAIVDPARLLNELDADNNTRLSARLGVGLGPDLVVGTLSGPSAVAPGQPLSASVQVCNQGTTPSSGGQMELFLSDDAVITATDRSLGQVSIGALNARECRTLSSVSSSPIPEGVYFLGALADRDNVVAELFEDNNARSGAKLGVGLRPDLVVTSVTGTPAVQVSEWLTANITVCNQGTTPGLAPVDLYLSRDAVITPRVGSQPSADAYVGPVYPSAPLAPGACETVSLTGMPHGVQEGTYFLGAVVDPAQLEVELLEDNNVTLGTRLGVGYRPDFVVTSVTAPTPLSLGAPFTASFQVCNHGTQQGVTSLELFLSKDAVITPPIGPGALEADLPVGATPAFNLAPGQCETGTVPIFAGIPFPGSWYLGAIADVGNATQELFEDNNRLAGTYITFNP